MRRSSCALVATLGLAVGFATETPAAARGSRMELAEKLLEVLKIERDLALARETIAPMMIRADPSFSGNEDVVLQWIESTMSWENVAERLVPLYAEAFDQSQLEAMIAFYETPAGQRAVEMLPILTQKQLELGIALAQEHGPELQARIAERLAGPEIEDVGLDEDAHRETRARMSAVGAAMFSWLSDRMADPDSPAARDADNEAGPRTWERCPPISGDELHAILVPDYLQELPRRDGWGHELQFCLERDKLMNSRFLAGIRSAGRDGAFEADASDLDAPRRGMPDVVWLDAVFLGLP